VIFRWLCFPQVVQKQILVRWITEWSLMASCVKNIRTKNYQNLIIGFQVTVKNVGDGFLRHCVQYNKWHCSFLVRLN